MTPDMEFVGVLKDLLNCNSLIHNNQSNYFTERSPLNFAFNYRTYWGALSKERNFLRSW